MTIREAIDNINKLVPNQYDDSIKIGWLSKLDMRVFNTIILTHEHEYGIEFSGYDDETAEDTELLVPDMYDDIYRYWLESQIDFSNQEINKYNNSAGMYNGILEEYSKYYNRNHMPIHSGSNTINF